MLSHSVKAPSLAAGFFFAGGHGYQEDPDSGLKLLGHRYYDASTGRFLTRDPIKDGRNWYAYCENNPLSAVDPEGLRIKWDIRHNSQQTAIAIWLWLIHMRNTASGGSIVDDLLNGDTEYTIIVDDQSEFSSWYYPPSHTLRFNGGDRRRWQWSDTDGNYHDFTIERQVAHEIGHIRVNSETDPGLKGEQKNVDLYENPISHELGDPRSRGVYGKHRPRPPKPGRVGRPG